QGRWRKAVGLHKALQRTKRKMPGQKRLEQLEQIVKLTGLKEQWKSSPTWKQFLGIPAPATPSPLDGYLALAKWNRGIKVASEDIQAVLIDPVSVTADQARGLRREFSTVKMEITTAIAAVKDINAKLKRIYEFGGSNLIDKVLEKTSEFTEALKEQFEWLELEVRSQATFSQVIAGCDAVLERSSLKSQIQPNARIKSLLGDLYTGVDTDCATAIEALSFGQSIDGLNLSPQVKYKLRTGHPIEACRTLAAALEPVHTGLQQVESLSNALSQFGKFELETWTGAPADEDLELFVSALHGAVQKAVEDQDLLIPWSLYLTRRKEANELALSEFVELLERKRIKPDELSDAYAYCTYSTITREAFRNIPQLGRFTGL